MWLAIDQGTTSTRAVVFGPRSERLAWHQIELPQAFPASGWVEHDANRIWSDTVACCAGALAAGGVPGARIRALGITNQRETIVLWERASGQPLAPAIVWQDRRTSAWCASHKNDEAWLTARTGLLLDPYFSATKLAWLLDHVPGARARAARGELAAGTVDCWLIWKLTGGRVHATDATNASRTLLANLETRQWDQELLAYFDIPENLLPEIRDCAADYGATEEHLFGAAMPIRGVAGDQHAATVGQACLSPGMVKSTYGTGGFMLLNTGRERLASRHRLLSTLAYQVGGEPTYALEGSIFMAGATVQWLRDGLGLIQAADETAGLAASVADTGGVYFVPAFTGLGAPYWDPEARGLICGLTRDTRGAHLVRAGLEATAWQTRDLLTAMRADGRAAAELRVDGGMVANDWFAQCLADTLEVPVMRPRNAETTALGVTWLAMLGAGAVQSLGEAALAWQAERRFLPEKNPTIETRYAGWQRAVARARH